MKPRGVTVAELKRWIGEVRVQERYSVLGLGLMRVVQHKDFDAFVAQLRADLTAPLGPSGDLEIFPPGARPFYCLLVDET